MAVYTTSNPTSLTTKLVYDSSADAGNDADGDNVTAATSGVVYMLQIDNTANSGSAAYVKIVDASSAVPGTTAPVFVFYAPASGKVTYNLPEGHIYSAGVSIWCSTSAATADTTNPGSAVKVRILAT